MLTRFIDFFIPHNIFLQLKNYSFFIYFVFNLSLLILFDIDFFQLAIVNLALVSFEFIEILKLIRFYTELDYFHANLTSKLTFFSLIL